jgi:hypothetical protein
MSLSRSFEELSRSVIVLTSLVCLAGCAVPAQWVPTGGSRADGTVDLSYQYGLFEQPVEDQSQAVALATARCLSWGYSGAEAFAGGTILCSQATSNGCIRFVVTRRYQCTGMPMESGAPIAPSGISYRSSGEGLANAIRQYQRYQFTNDLIENFRP